LKYADTSPWIEGGQDDWKDLTDGRVPVLFKKNSVIFQEGDESHAIRIVKSGRILVTCYRADGTEKQLYIARPGAMFGESSCFSQRCNNAAAIAIVDSRVFCVPRAEALRKMTQNWSLTESFIRSICRKEAILKHQVIELSFADSAQRVAQILLDLADAYGEKTPDGLCIMLNFTQQDMASLAKTSRVTISGVFRKFYSLGVLSKKNGRLYLNDLEAMRGIVSVPGGTARITGQR
jgi:CRP-like cAMP-binding protein